MEKMKNDELVANLLATALKLGQLMQEASKRLRTSKHPLIWDYVVSWIQGKGGPHHQNTMVVCLNVDSPNTQ